MSRSDHRNRVYDATRSRCGAGKAVRRQSHNDGQKFCTNEFRPSIDFKTFTNESPTHCERVAAGGVLVRPGVGMWDASPAENGLPRSRGARTRWLTRNLERTERWERTRRSHQFDSWERRHHVNRGPSRDIRAHRALRKLAFGKVRRLQNRQARDLRRFGGGRDGKLFLVGDGPTRDLGGALGIYGRGDDAGGPA